MAAEWKLAKGWTWRRKLEQEHPNHGKVVTIPKKMEKRFGKGKMLIPKPLDVDAVMRSVRKGKLITASQLREKLAQEAGADSSCAMTTGIFVRIVAETAEEDLRAGRKRVTPYWRVLMAGGKLNEKLPGGTRAQAARLRKEGFTIQRGTGKQPPRVKDYEKYLAKL